MTLLSLLFNMLSRLVITFLPSSKRLLISWLESPSAVLNSVNFLSVLSDHLPVYVYPSSYLSPISISSSAFYLGVHIENAFSFNRSGSTSGKPMWSHRDHSVPAAQCNWQHWLSPGESTRIAMTVNLKRKNAIFKLWIHFSWT